MREKISWVVMVLFAMSLSYYALSGYATREGLAILTVYGFLSMGYMLIRITREYVYEEAGRVSEGFVRKMMDVYGVVLFGVGIGMGVFIWVM